jgi:hypothetical protein
MTHLSPVPQGDDSDGIEDYYGWTRPPSPEAVKAALREEFGERWSIIHSSADRWWAFRLPMVGETPMSGVDLDADTAEELAAALRKVCS